MSLFSWQCQIPCRLSLAFIIDWRVVARNTDLRRRSVLILKLEFEPVCQVSEVPDIVLEHQDDLFGGRDALVALAGSIQVVHCPTNVLEKEGPISEGGASNNYFMVYCFC